MAKVETCKIVAVGDGAVGKTCLLMVYANNEFPDKYIPTVFENYDTRVKHNEKIISMSLWDTAGQEEYDQLRYLSYPNASIFLICFSLISHTSLENVKHRWIKELNEKCTGQKYKIVLVGTKSDARDDPNIANNLKNDKIVTAEDGKRVAAEIQAVEYIETSALTRHNVQKVFECCLETCYGKKKSETGAKSPSGTEKKKCTIL
ncbi:Ras-related protein Rac [Acrasis kona]|uniref:Ras-related protein Rac n=1 Tax=Acrasis kona TaxID=1008807 RepID=A0AAW2YUN8_9EUKA